MHFSLNIFQENEIMCKNRTCGTEFVILFAFSHYCFEDVTVYGFILIYMEMNVNPDSLCACVCLCVLRVYAPCAFYAMLMKRQPNKKGSHRKLCRWHRCCVCHRTDSNEYRKNISGNGMAGSQVEQWPATTKDTQCNTNGLTILGFF